MEGFVKGAPAAATLVVRDLLSPSERKRAASASGQAQEAISAAPGG
jgi:hypothetical protein